MPYIKNILFAIGVVLAIFAIQYVAVYVPDVPADFLSLSAAQKYAEQMPEHPIADNNDWFKPDYSSFFKEKEPSLIKKLAYLIGIDKPYWSVSSFKDLLAELTQQRKKIGFRYHCVQKIDPTPRNQFVIWGNLQGAFHSLVRDLEELRNRSIIDDELKIIDPQYYFVFDGNVVSRSAYSLETLTLVLQLMKMNPEHVIYIAGTHEMDEEWKNYDMAEALDVLLWWKPGETDPVFKAVDEFFDTLPLAVYLIGKKTETTVEVVCLTNQLSHSLLKEQLFGDFFTQDKTDVWCLSKQREPSTKQVRVQAKIICNFEKTNHYLTDGLRLLLPDEEATVWGVLSSPTSSYKERFGFTNDSFTLVRVAPELANWTISLCKQSSEEKGGFDCSETYKLVSGILTPLSFKPKGELRIGSMMDLSGIYQDFCEYRVEGLQARFQDQNKIGGVKGLTVKLIVKDDHYNPAKSKELLNEFVEEGVNIIVMPFGTEALDSFTDLLKEKKIIVLFPSGGSREESLKNLIYYRPSNYVNGREITKYSVEQLKAQSIAFFFSDTAFGITTTAGGVDYLKEVGFGVYKKFSFKRNTLTYEDQIKEIKDMNPDTYALFCPPGSAREFINQIGVNFLVRDYIIGHSDLNTNRMRLFLMHNGIKATVANSVPNPHDATLTIAQEYRESMKRHKVDVNVNSFEAYIVASIFIETLKKIKGTITKEKVIQVLEKMKNFDLGGILLNFDPEQRQLSHTLWLSRLPDEEYHHWRAINLQASATS